MWTVYAAVGGPAAAAAAVRKPHVGRGLAPSWQIKQQSKQQLLHCRQAKFSVGAAKIHHSDVHSPFGCRCCRGKSHLKPRREGILHVQTYINNQQRTLCRIQFCCLFYRAGKLQRNGECKKRVNFVAFHMCCNEHGNTYQPNSSHLSFVNFVQLNV